MKQKKKGKICFVIYIAGKRFFFTYDVIVKQNLKKQPANNYCSRSHYPLSFILNGDDLNFHHVLHFLPPRFPPAAIRITFTDE